MYYNQVELHVVRVGGAWSSASIRPQTIVISSLGGIRKIR